VPESIHTSDKIPTQIWFYYKIRGEGFPAGIYLRGIRISFIGMKTEY
jgi:hypothetical protein